MKQKKVKKNNDTLGGLATHTTYTHAHAHTHARTHAHTRTHARTHTESFGLHRLSQSSENFKNTTSRIRLYV